MDVKTAHGNAPERICHVSHTQLSLARHYGSINYNGKLYWYVPETDELIRDDVRKREATEAKRIARAEKERWQKEQGSLFRQPGDLPGF